MSQCGESPINYTTAYCFTVLRQKINHRPKKSDQGIKILQQGVDIASGDVHKKKQQRSQKLFITPTVVLEKWLIEGLYITDEHLQYACNNFSIVD